MDGKKRARMKNEENLRVDRKVKEYVEREREREGRWGEEDIEAYRR